MSNQFAPRTVSLDHDEAVYATNLLEEWDVPFDTERTASRTLIIVSPANADRLASAVEGGRASKRAEEGALLREARASIDVGGLSVDDAERLIGLVKDFVSRYDPDSEFAEVIPESMREALGIRPKDPEFMAVARVRFIRSHRPSNREVADYIRTALHHYFEDHEEYCGISDDEIDPEGAIIDVTVERVVQQD